ncbi:MAG: FAD:protein FMN transferase [Candidatus Dormibacterales bacterium]
MTATVFGIADGRALGTSMRVVVTRPEAIASAKAAVDDVIAAIDQAASRFREDSELSLLNARPETDVSLSPLLAQAIAAALRGARASGGAVDPTVGTAIRLAGYDADFAQLPADGEPLLLVAERVPGWKVIAFDAAKRTVRLPRGVEIDLGATAKALAADLAAAAASRASGGGGALVSLGGDIAVAGLAPEGGWPIQTSEDSAAPIQDGEESISIVSGGVATSSTTVRRWTRGGVQMHHIFDPATGLPAQTRWRTASVAAGSCVDANIASTAALVKSEQAIAWLEVNHLPGRLVGVAGEICRVAGWPQPSVSDMAPRVL